MDKKLNAFKNNLNDKQEFDEIDLRSFFGIFIRNKIIVSSFAIGGFVFSCIYGLSIPPIWQGEFRMVLEQKKSESTFATIDTGIELLNEAGLGALFGGKGKNVQNELEILQSPYTLNSVFEFVKSEKLKKGEDLSKLTFENWLMGSLAINQRGNSNIMQVRYKDDDKQLILSVLDKIISEYQKYSTAENKKAFEEQQNFLKKQIEIHDLKTKNSYNALDNYALSNNLTVKIQDGVSVLSQEFLQIKTRDEIFLIKQLLDLYSTNADLRTIIYSLPKENQLVANFSTQYRSIDSLNVEIAKLKTKYKADVYPLKDYLIEREILKDSLRKDLFIFLENRLVQLENILKQGENNNSKILKFKELTRESERNQKVLIALEGIYQQISIEKSKFLEPWRVISRPTLSNNSVYPNKKFIAISGMLLSLLIGTLLSILRELKSGILYSRYDVLKNIPLRLIKELDINDVNSITNLSRNLESMAQITLKKGQKINLIKVGSIESEMVNKFVKNLNSEISNDLFLSSNLTDNIESELNFLLLQNSKITKSQISNILEDINIKNIKIEGFILLS